MGKASNFVAASLIVVMLGFTTLAGLATAQEATPSANAEEAEQRAVEAGT